MLKKSNIKNKRILVTGGAGSIGSELVRQLCVKNKVFILDINENKTFLLRNELNQQGCWVHSRTGDVKDKDVVSDVFEDFKPQIVFHCAALKHVAPNEEYPIEAINTNIIGTYNVMAEAKRWECLEKFVFISTDKVVNAKCIMGITKLCAEGLVRRAGKQFVSVRFANVLGSDGSVIPIWQNQVDRGKPMTITHPEMTRYFMTIPSACELVIEAAERGKDGEVYILDMGTPINIKDLATAIVERSGRDIKLKDIGIRQGETLDEKLMTTDEEQTAIKSNKFFILK